MYVCMYVCLYVCTVCMYGYQDFLLFPRCLKKKKKNSSEANEASHLCGKALLHLISLFPQCFSVI